MISTNHAGSRSRRSLRRFIGASSNFTGTGITAPDTLDRKLTFRDQRLMWRGHLLPGWRPDKPFARLFATHVLHAAVVEIVNYAPRPKHRILDNRDELAMERM